MLHKYLSTHFNVLVIHIFPTPQRMFCYTAKTPICVHWFPSLIRVHKCLIVGHLKLHFKKHMYWHKIQRVKGHLFKHPEGEWVFDLALSCKVQYRNIFLKVISFVYFSRVILNGLNLTGVKKRIIKSKTNFCHSDKSHKNETNCSGLPWSNYLQIPLRVLLKNVSSSARVTCAHTVSRDEMKTGSEGMLWKKIQ